MSMRNMPIKRYIFYSFLFVMIFFNIIILVRSVSHFIPNMSMFGDNADSLNFYSFWADILCSIGSFAMVFITAKTVDLNERQLKELKRQWEDDHKPYLTCHLVTHDHIFRLCVKNASNVVAKDVHISIDNYLDKEPLRFNKLKTFFEHQVFLIPPQENIYFNLFISAYPEEENLPKGHLLISLKCGEFDFGDFKLYPSNHAYVIYDKDSSESEISNQLEDLNKTIKNKKFI